MALDTGTAAKDAGGSDAAVDCFDTGNQPIHGVIFYNYGDKAAMGSIDGFKFQCYIPPATHDGDGVASPGIAVLDYAHNPIKGVVQAKNQSAGQNFSGLRAIARL